MIVDHIAAARRYDRGTAWEDAFRFLATLDPAARENEYAIRGTDVFARIFSYETLPREQARLEAHREYIDVQMILSGGERIGWYPRGGLSVSEPYDPSRDVEFYAADREPSSWLALTPGLCAIFFPDDAHLTQVAGDTGPQKVKKVVVKIKRALTFP